MEMRSERTLAPARGRCGAASGAELGERRAQRCVSVSQCDMAVLGQVELSIRSASFNTASERLVDRRTLLACMFLILLFHVFTSTFSILPPSPFSPLQFFLFLSSFLSPFFLQFFPFLTPFLLSFSLSSPLPPNPTHIPQVSSMTKHRHHPPPS